MKIAKKFCEEMSKVSDSVEMSKKVASKYDIKRERKNSDIVWLIFTDGSIVELDRNKEGIMRLI